MPDAVEIDLDFQEATIFPSPNPGSTESIIIDNEIIDYSAVATTVNTAGANAGWARIETYVLTVSQRGANGTTPSAHNAQYWDSEVVGTPDSPEVSNYAIFIEETPFIISNKFNDIKWRNDMLTSVITGNRKITRYDKSGNIYPISENRLPTNINPGKITWKDNIANIIINTNTISYATQYTGAISRLDIVSYSILNGIAFDNVNNTLFGGSQLMTLTESEFTLQSTNPLQSVSPRNVFPQNTMSNYFDADNFADTPPHILTSQLISIEDIKSDTIGLLLYQTYDTTYSVQSGMVNYVDVFMYPYMVPSTIYKPNSFYTSNVSETLEQFSVHIGRFIVYNQSNKQTFVDADNPLNRYSNLINVSKPPWAKYLSINVITPYREFGGRYEQSIDIIIIGQEG